MKTKSRRQKAKVYRFSVGKRRFRVLADRVLFTRVLRGVHGRFWGLTAICIFTIGFSICYIIRPDLWRIDSAFSDFGTDIRTSPYYAGSVFFGAYGLWRWRNYLHKTWKRQMPVTLFLTLTIIGLYMTALMPSTWHPWPSRLHFIGIAVAFSSMVLTVVFDGILTRTSRDNNPSLWRTLRLLSFVLILGGGWLTFGSTNAVGWYEMALLGELMIWAGYGLWICFKTYQGEGPRSNLSRLLNRFVLID
jgi:hypothetical protein